MHLTADTGNLDIPCPGGESEISVAGNRDVDIDYVNVVYSRCVRSYDPGCNCVPILLVVGPDAVGGFPASPLPRCRLDSHLVARTTRSNVDRATIITDHHLRA